MVTRSELARGAINWPEMLRNELCCPRTNEAAGVNPAARPFWVSMTISFKLKGDPV